MRTKTKKLFFLSVSLLIVGVLGIGEASFSMPASNPFTQAQLSQYQLTAEHAVSDKAVKRWVQSIQRPSTMKTSIALKKRAQLMILVSSSMPISLIRQYVDEAKKVHGVLVLRGLVNNSFRDTARFAHNVLGKKHGGFKIDPIVFEKLSIRRVPAILLFTPGALSCLNQKQCMPDPASYALVRGGVSLSYALSQIVQKDDQQQASKELQEDAVTLLKKLQGAADV